MGWGEKIGSIGVGIKRWTTCHGFALNVCPDLSYFSGIVPCGIDGCEMTSIEASGARGIGVDEFAMIDAIALCRSFRI